MCAPGRYVATSRTTKKNDIWLISKIKRAPINNSNFILIHCEMGLFTTGPCVRACCRPECRVCVYFLRELGGARTCVSVGVCQLTHAGQGVRLIIIINYVYMPFCCVSECSVGCFFCCLLRQPFGRRRWHAALAFAFLSYHLEIFVFRRKEVDNL